MPAGFPASPKPRLNSPLDHSVVYYHSTAGRRIPRRHHWTPTAAGDSLNYFGGKGLELELTPTEHTEIILGVPPYQIPVKGPDGFSNVPLTLKYRFLAGNEEQGNYIVTGFLAGSIPLDHAYDCLRQGLPKARFSRHDWLDNPTGGHQKSVTPVAYNQSISVSRVAQVVA